MRELRSGVLTVQKSKFYAHLYEVDGEEDIDVILGQHRKMYRKAVHHCWAFRIIGQISVERSKDDGEVGHPGRVLLETLRLRDSKRHMLVVSRIFGRVKLGVGGVSRAFRDAGNGLFRDST